MLLAPVLEDAPSIGAPSTGAPSTSASGTGARAPMLQSPVLHHHCFKHRLPALLLETPVLVAFTLFCHEFENVVNRAFLVLIFWGGKLVGANCFAFCDYMSR